MRRHPQVFPLVFCLIFATTAWAGGHPTLEGSFSRERQIGNSSVDPRGSLALDYPLIERQLEIEAELSVSAFDGGTEIPFEVLLKKPFFLSSRIELTPGVGPLYALVRKTETNGGFWGAEGVIELRYNLRKKLGIFLEPSYSFLARNGYQQEIGAGFGIAIAL